MLAAKQTVLSSRPLRGAVAARSAAAHSSTTQKAYYVAMNVFKVKPESSADFEEVWKTRESRLKQMPGFVRFAMLRCENIPGKYVSQTYWESKEAFDAWTTSSAFSASHGSNGSGHGQGGQPAGAQEGSGGNKRPDTMSMLEGRPSPEFFTCVTMTE